MYTDDQYIRYFRRFLKENGEYRALGLHTTVINEFMDRIRSDNPWVTKEVIGANNNEQNYSFMYNLMEFYDFTYQLNDGILIKEIAALFEQFLKERSYTRQFICEVNVFIREAFEKPEFYTPFTRTYKHLREINTIEDYIDIKTKASPYGLILSAFPWPNNNEFYSNMHKDWFNLLRSKAKDEEKT